MERNDRQRRLTDERTAMVSTTQASFDKIDDFRSEIKHLKNYTAELSKKYLAEIEEAAKKDRIAWQQMQQITSFK